MKQFFTFITIFLYTFNTSIAQIEWTGPTVTFSKASSADWTLEANQDRMTSNVWFTRQNNSLFFNIAVNENFPDSLYSPADTEWALGSISDGITNLTFDEYLEVAVDNEGDACPPCQLNVPMVLHLITDNIYIDFMLTSWNEETVPPPGDNQGGFGVPGGQLTYERSSDQTSNTDDFETNNNLKLFPNPSNRFIQILGLTTTKNYQIYNVLGEVVNNGIISNNEQINIQNLDDGLYFLQLGEDTSFKFLKE